MNRFNRILAVLLLLAAVAGPGASEALAGDVVRASEKMKPKWMNGVFPQGGNGSYYFKVAQGDGGQLSEAKANAVLALVGDLSASQGVKIEGSALEKMDAESRNQVYDTHTEHRYTFRLDYDRFKTAFTQVDTYWEEYRDGRCTCWVLFEVAKSPGEVRFEEVAFTTKYGARGFFRSLVPGMGQLYKGSKWKGGLLMGATVAGAGMIVVSENLRATYEKRMEEHPKYKDFYNKYADRWGNVRNACIGLTAAIYLYNLVDAAVAPGRKRAVIRKGGADYALVPVCGDRQAGLAFVLRF